MLEIQNRLLIKQKLLSEIEELKNNQKIPVDSPLTDLEIQPQQVELSPSKH